MRSGIVLLAAVAILAIGVPVLGQGPGFGGKAESFEPTLMVDWAAFQSALAGKSRLEIYYQVYNFGLQFLPDGKEFTASYDISAQVYDDGGDQVSSYERTRQVRVASVAQTRSKFDYRTSQFNLDLSPGKYTVKFVLTDRGSKTVVNREIKTNLPQLGTSQPTLSRIEFVQSVTDKSDSIGVFDKGNRVVIPSVSCAYGGDEDKRLLFYLEIYRGADSLEKTVLETVIRHRSKGMIYRDTIHVAVDEPVKRQLREISIAEMPPGDYELEVTLHGRRMKELDQQREPFSVLWSQEALLKLDWKTAISQIGYIAAPNELGQIKKAKTYEERRAAFDAFWAIRDPSAGTEENETKREFYRRINVANRHFSSMRREGWRTDRGRIYVINGEPDQIDDEPYSISSVPYQIWHYYRDGRYRRFLFVDKDEDGDYRLQFPYDGLNQNPDF